MKHPAREECRGCIWSGKGMYCAGLALRWAWYELLMTLPSLLKGCAVKPEPCTMKETEEEINAAD